MIVLEITEEEKRTIVNWYEHIIEESSHFGKAQYIFPAEEHLIEKIKNNKETKINLHDFEIKFIINWMEHSLNSKYGPSVYFLPGEESVFEKIKHLVRRIEKDEEKLQEQEKKAELEKSELDKLKIRIEQVSKKVSEIKRYTEDKKNRSIDEKISATIQLRIELDEMRKKLKIK